MRLTSSRKTLQPDVLAKSKSGRSVFHDAATRLSKSSPFVRTASVFTIHDWVILFSWTRCSPKSNRTAAQESQNEESTQSNKSKPAVANWRWMLACSGAGQPDNSRAVRLDAHLSAENDDVHAKGALTQITKIGCHHAGDGRRPEMQIGDWNRVGYRNS